MMTGNRLNGIPIPIVISSSIGRPRSAARRFACVLCLGLLFCFPFPSHARYLEILAAGDVTLAWRMLEAPAPLLSPFAQERIRQAHVFLWNCEASGPACSSKPNRFLFHTDGSLLADFLFPNAAAITANNHVFDGYQDGAANLLFMLDYLGIRHNGLFHRQSGYSPLLLTQPPLPAVYLLTGSPMSQRGSGPDIFTLNYTGLLEEVRSLRNRQPTAYIIVYGHDGEEGKSGPSPRQVYWAERLAFAGADVIFFSHDHRYGEVVILEGTPRRTLVAWSLGNFLFGGNSKWKDHPDVRLLSIIIDTRTGQKYADWIYGMTSNWSFILYENER